MRLLVSTDKGLLEYSSQNDSMQLSQIHFLGYPVGVFHHDERSSQWWVAVNHKHWGPKLHYSTDFGQNWHEQEAPRFGTEESLRSIWCIEHGENDVDSTFYVGVEPAALFRTENNGQSFELVEGLWNHPTRPQWEGGGKGSMAPFLHALIVDPDNPKHLYAGISCAGVFQSFDGGQTWQPTNEGLPADFLPTPDAEVGQDPHRIVISKQNPNVLWQQNHCGIFRSEDGGQIWQNVSSSNGFPSYGFAMAVDETNDKRAWVVPCQSDSIRLPFNTALSVLVTEDGGVSWRDCSKGLPQAGSFDIVLRHALSINGSTLAFGTNNGNLYISEDYGERWNVVSNNLSTVRAVTLLL